MLPCHLPPNCRVALAVKLSTFYCTVKSLQGLRSWQVAVEIYTLRYRHLEAING
jgi:hypothetical protein